MLPTRQFSRLALPVIALTMLGPVACKKLPTAVVSVTGFTVVQGNGQTAQAGAALPTPVVLRVIDSNGDPVPSANVVFAVTAGGGTVNPPSILSDVHGEVSVKWTLGLGVPLQSLTASVAESPPVTLFATALYPATIAAAQGNGQTGKAAQTLANNIVIRVTGDNNVPLAGIPVQFQVLSGGGGISPQTAITNVFGEVTAKWTLGLVAGGNSATATAGTLSPVFLVATATP
jgi:hypothetical protein